MIKFVLFVFYSNKMISVVSGTIASCSYKLFPEATPSWGWGGCVLAFSLFTGPLCLRAAEAGGLPEQMGSGLLQWGLEALMQVSILAPWSS